MTRNATIVAVALGFALCEVSAFAQDLFVYPQKAQSKD
jgi:hypothetical protein